ncbi:MAG: FliM/FliN family flagellar motor C-terminal domain-containing protein [Rhizomicrobium sp.]
MAAGVRDWLPAEAFAADAVAAVLAEPLGRWSARWFARDRAVVADVRSAPAATAPSRVVRGDRAEAALSGRGKRQLLETALGAELAGQRLGDGDHAVLDAFAVRIVEDLVAILDEAFPAAAADDTRLRLSLALAQSDVIEVGLPREVLVPSLKARLGAVRATGDAPAGRREALASTRVAVEGFLGHAGLSLGELEALGVGDVVVLDRPVSVPVELRLPGGRKLAQGMLGRNNGRVAIQL